MTWALNAQASWWNNESHYNGYMQTTVEEIVATILADKKVLFVDTRTAQEYDEGHIPGAIRLQLADTEDFDISGMDKYELIVPYCLKDFRGFEVARALMEKGLDNVTMLEPAGLNGWKRLGLPTTTAKTTIDEFKMMLTSWGNENKLAANGAGQ